MAVAALSTLAMPAIKAGVHGLISLFHHKKKPEEIHQEASAAPDSGVAVTPSAMNVYKALIPATTVPLGSALKQAIPSLINQYVQKSDIAGPNMTSSDLPEETSPFQSSTNALLRSVMGAAPGILGRIAPSLVGGLQPMLGKMWPTSTPTVPGGI